jgi:hypothetical protein
MNNSVFISYVFRMNIRSIYKKPGGFILAIILWLAMASCDRDSIDRKFIDLNVYAVTDENVNVEISGLLKSNAHEHVFWMHGDSGDDAVLFPVTKEGEIIGSEFRNGIELKGIDNEDWEDIATDYSGNLFIGDIGNNCLCRHDLMILRFPEPDLMSDEVDQIMKYRFVYPGDFSAESKLSIPDAEALFFKNENLYILTKETKGKGTRLFELKDPDPSKINELQELKTIDFNDKVTAADISSDGKYIAILTSSSVWLLADFTGDDFFGGTIHKVFFEANQVESIAFSGEESLLIAEETGELYEINFSEFDF